MIILFVFFMLHCTKSTPHDQRCMLWRGKIGSPFNFKIITQLSTMKLHHAKKSLYKVVKHSRKYNHHISLFVFHCTKLYHSFQMYYGSEGKRNETFPKHSFLSKQRTKMDQLASRWSLKIQVFLPKWKF